MSLRQRYGSEALVTGASDGLGAAFAERLAVEGLDLVLVARRQATLEAVARDLRARYGVSVSVISLDLGEPGAAAALVDRVADRDIGIVVAAAGFGTTGKFVTRELATELNMIDVNCRSVVTLIHGMARQFEQRPGRSAIVLFGSLVGWQGAPLAATYGATKAFIQVFAEGIRAEFRSSRIDVLSCAPGPVHSGFASRAGMVMTLADTPADIAKGALMALGKRGTAVPGRVGKLLTYALAPLPRSARIAIMGRVMGQLAQT